MTLYGIPNCNTVKKAQDWLKSNKIDFEFHDFKKKGVTPQQLQAWFDAFGWEKVLNRQGLTFKKLSRAEQDAINNAEKAMEYLLQHTSAIKRPILERDDHPVSLGFTEDAYVKQVL